MSYKRPTPDEPGNVRIAISEGALREGPSGFAQFFHEHGERLIVGSVGAMSHRDAHRLRRGGQRDQPDPLWEEPPHLGRNKSHTQPGLHSGDKIFRAVVFASNFGALVVVTQASSNEIPVFG